jgi:hypothetical protein
LNIVVSAPMSQPAEARPTIRRSRTVRLASHNAARRRSRDAGSAKATMARTRARTAAPRPCRWRTLALRPVRVMPDDVVEEVAHVRIAIVHYM